MAGYGKAPYGTTPYGFDYVVVDDVVVDDVVEDVVFDIIPAGRTLSATLGNARSLRAVFVSIAVNP